MGCQGKLIEPNYDTTEAFSFLVPAIESALHARNGVKCFSYKGCIILFVTITCFTSGLLLLSKWQDDSLKQTLGSS